MPTAATPGLARPQLKPGLRRVWRDRATVQIGLTPDVGVIVTGLAPGEAELVDRLDGSQQVVDLVRWGSEHGVDPHRVHRLIELLDAAGVLTGPPTDRAYRHRLALRGGDLEPDASAWAVVYPDGGDGWRLLAERTRHRVLVLGTGPVAAAVTAAVEREGMPVTSRPRLPDATRPDPDRDPDPDPDLAAYAVVVLVGADAAPLTAGIALLGAHRPHLSVVAGADRVVVGPLVLPGRTACLRCLELHRTDRDPGWPGVAAQLAAPPPRPRGASGVTGLGAALAALQVAGWLDGRRPPASAGATLTVTLPDGLTTRRAWPRHPRCGCAWLAAAVPAADGTSGPPGQATMGPWPTSPAAR